MIFWPYVSAFSVQLFCRVYKLQDGTKNVKKYYVAEECATFRSKFDENQRMLSTVTGHDDLISGILSKQKGQILRVAAICHVLSELDVTAEHSDILSHRDIAAAIDFVEVCSEHTCTIAGRPKISDAVDNILSGLI